MDYKLAEQLKKARFPRIRDIEVGAINYPTLSELISECVRLVPNLFKLEMRGGVWIADTNWELEEGKTPKEAVAKLWLKLNKTTKLHEQITKTNKYGVSRKGV